jgi:molybdenum cofactor biosynthesis protein B
MSVEEHRKRAPAVLGFGVLTVSDTRGPDDDAGGNGLRELAAAAGHRVESSAWVADDVELIRAALRQMLAVPAMDVVVATGGTGFAPRDVTVEAVAPLFERPIEGFGELFRMLSYAQVGAAAMLSRAAAGLIGRQAVFLLPGSPKAALLAMEKLILPEAPHLLALVRQAEPLAGKLGESQLIRACEVANLDPEVRAIEQQFDALPDETPEPQGPPRQKP